MERWSLRLTTAIAVAACPITTWWLIGDLSESPTAEDYILRAPELTGDQQLAIGFVATLLFVVAAYVIAIGLRAQHLTWVELRPVLPLFLAGIFCGFGWRVVTARADGANIGGGMILMFGPFFLIAMIAWSCVLRWFSRAR